MAHDSRARTVYNSNRDLKYKAAEQRPSKWSRLGAAPGVPRSGPRPLIPEARGDARQRAGPTLAAPLCAPSLGAVRVYTQVYKAPRGLPRGVSRQEPFRLV